MPTVLSLFSGAGGFDIGFERAGFDTVYQCEWDEACNETLAKHWPHVPRWGDITTLTGREILNAVGPIDVVIWGSPCQDLSVAGKRAGLAGDKSSMFFEGIRIINELRKASNGRYPRVSVWENVAGALNSNQGADFGRVIDEMAAAGALVQEWRVLDAQYFGVPQRRRRVFVVAVFDPAVAERCPDQLLSVRESMRRNPAQGGSAQETPPREAEERAGVRSFRMLGFGHYADDDSASSVKARDYKDATDLVTHDPILIDRAAYNQGENALYVPYISDQPVIPSLVARGPHAVATFGFDSTFGNNAGVYEDVSPPVKVGSGTGIASPPAVSTGQTVRRLTPIECERLMGWPDDWTAGVSDTQRYKQCGNGVAAPVAEWVGRRIIEVIQGGNQ